MAKNFYKKNLSLAIRTIISTGVITASLQGAQVFAQAEDDEEQIATELEQDSLEEVVVLGVRRSLQKSADLKRDSAQIMDVITAEDIGKLPDENAAQALQRVTGVQIGNRNGQGSEIRVRGFGNVNIEVNGTTFVGANLSNGASRGVTLEDIPAELLAGIEVIKAPAADNIEGGLTATVNLKTRRPLDLDALTLAGSAKNTYSSVAEEDNQAYSLFVGRNWEDKFGVLLNVVSAETLTRNDRVDYRRWDAVPFLGASPDDADAHFLTVTDAAGRSAVVIAPQQIELEQKEVIQDRLATNFSMQLRVNERLELYSDFLYTEYEETEATNNFVFGLLDINTSAGIRLDRDLLEPVFGEFTRGTTARDANNDLLDVDGEITLLGAGFEIPSSAQEGNSHRMSGGATFKDATTANFKVGGSWSGDKLHVSGYVSTGSSVFDSITSRQEIKGSYGNVNCAWRDPRPLDPFTGSPVGCAENLRFAYDLRGGDIGSLYLDPTLSSVNPVIQAIYGDADGDGRPDGEFIMPDGSAVNPDDTAMDYLLDPYSYALAFASLNKTEFTSDEDALVLDFDYDLEHSPLTNLEFGVRLAQRAQAREVQEGIGTHWRHECTLSAYQLDAEGCAANGGVFTTDRNGNEEANSLYTQPGNRQGLAMITDASFLSGISGGGNYPNQWLGGNPWRFAGDPVAGMFDAWQMTLMSDKIDDFKVREDTTAGYLKGNFDLADGTVTGNLGLRVVQTDVSATGYQVTEGASSQILFEDLFALRDIQAVTNDVSYTDVLPSLNLNYSIREDMLLRFAANRAMARPNMRDYVEGFFVTNSSARRGLLGNPDLDPWRVNQVDLSFEWYFSEQGGYAAAAAFYKDLTSFITSQEVVIVGDESMVNNFSNVEVAVAPCNARGISNSPRFNLDGELIDPGRVCTATQSINDTGEASGVELTYQQPLPLGFMAAFNYTYLDSETPDGFSVPGMAPHTVNAFAYYEHAGFSARLAYRWQDESLIRASGVGGRPEYNKARSQLDLTLNYDWGDSLSFSLAGINLTEEGQEAYTQIEERLLRAEQFDRSFVFSVRGRF